MAASVSLLARWFIDHHASPHQIVVQPLRRDLAAISKHVRNDRALALIERLKHRQYALLGEEGRRHHGDQICLRPVRIQTGFLSDGL